MQNRIVTFATIFLLAAPAVAGAQHTTSATSATRAELAPERRLQLESRKQAAAALRAARTQEQREQVRARRAAPGGTISEAQVQFRSELRAYRSGLRERARDLNQQVQAGTRTSAEMAAELKAYREANRPQNPSGADEMPKRKAAPEKRSTSVEVNGSAQVRSSAAART